MPLLLKDNLLELQNSIPINNLPKVFRDAIAMCRRLGIDYIWIDSLCLIQDDAIDCERDIANMGNIYTNAFLNFGATGVADFPEWGLFYESNQDDLLPFHVPVHRKGHVLDYLVCNFDSCRVPGSTTLMSRGWVLQERLLSRRSIYFDDVLSWECHAMLANEVFPGGIPWDRDSLPYWGIHQPFKLSRLLDIEDSKHDAKHKKAKLYERWRLVCMAFAKCRLTYSTDALPAISGLARAFGRALDDVYLVGLWQKDLILGLPW
ncbi:hypothetical protein HBI56_194010 [Parastagonospora nodorum]|nr:hypothetical protein HBH56_205660 [Parastagonospora nodorum]QRC94767.1 hypothetical protein JI435_309160 [Parastagonospora nodorum SN15]KAH3923742.1 hypothetical protein HBH54_204530 [Parastagonospora nodorum]KAH3942380.1 hypothetical protein HBH53_189820 [Parastagonospora nodorum]KAH3962294.1 hypothetical protein HBH51_175960 [Parastagonospora nodorum]